jgi:hypothetical protein
MIDAVQGYKELSRYSDELWAGRPGFDSRWRQGIFLYTIASIPILNFTQSKVTEAVCSRLKRPGREIDNSLPSKAEVKNGEVYLHSSYAFVA